MNIKKRAFTLLEVMISLVLVGILLSFLFSFFRQTLAAKGQAKVLKEKIMQRELFQLRLNQFFMRSAKEKKASFRPSNTQMLQVRPFYWLLIKAQTPIPLFAALCMACSTKQQIAFVSAHGRITIYLEWIPCSRMSKNSL